MKTEFQVEGMSCQHCVAAVTNAIREHDDGAQVQVDLAAGRVAVESTQSVEALKAALMTAGKTAEFKIYPGAPHGFHADYRASYRKEAAEDAWGRMQAWFRKYGVFG